MTETVDHPKAARNALARSLWRIDHRREEFSDTEASRQAYLSERTAYVQKAVQIINKLERENLALVPIDKPH